MIIELEPTQKIPLTYELADGTLAPTRYIQSKVINFETRAVIKTQNLTDNGSGDFSNYDHTPKSLAITKQKYFEVITTVYKTSAYTTTDELRYATTKQVYYVVEKYGGALLGGRETGWVGEKTDVDYKKLIKEFFSYNPDKIKSSNSFARRFINSISTLDIISGDINKVPVLITNRIEELSNDLADVISGIGNKVISDIRLDMSKIDLSSLEKKLIGKLEDNNRNTSSINDSINRISTEKLDGVSDEILKAVDIKELANTLSSKIDGFAKGIKLIKEYYYKAGKKTLYGKVNEIDGNLDMIKKELSSMKSVDNLAGLKVELISYLDNIEQKLYEMENSK